MEVHSFTYENALAASTNKRDVFIGFHPNAAQNISKEEFEVVQALPVKHVKELNMDLAIKKVYVNAGSTTLMDFVQEHPLLCATGFLIY
jgi:predicted peroxiredoxin